ncbi:hypothetical protein [Fundicoccus culcitae]|uniref:Uncharacterized protein n=1 Tax=Fundicoccus culcitae TaxID=2969821 RepID=A0ABY5P473_9LACT|nr:hypothetical protein [Fundicoccus culcitae]UUX33180.1 hypothetical protein NRE15_09735 [Fundicoccus culcitae]
MIHRKKSAFYRVDVLQSITARCMREVVGSRIKLISHQTPHFMTD